MFWQKICFIFTSFTKVQLSLLLKANVVAVNMTKARLSYYPLNFDVLILQQLESTNSDMKAQARKAKARKEDASYYQSKAETLERQNEQLNSKLVGGDFVC